MDHLRHGGWLGGFTLLDDGLRCDGQANKGVDDHERGERNLRTKRGSTYRYHTHRLGMAEVDRRDMARHDRRNRRVPGKARPDDRDINAVAGCAEEIPAFAERIGRERHDVLTLDQQEHQIMCHMIADGDRDERQCEAAGKLHRRAGHKRRHCADRQVGAEEQKPEPDEAGRLDRDRVVRAQAGERGAKPAFEVRPCRGGDEPVIKHGREQEQHECHHGRRDGLVVEQPCPEWSKQQLPPLRLNLRLSWRKSGEGAEHDVEHLAVLHPDVTTEHEHADQGEDRIRGGETGNVSRHGGAWVDKLDPRKGEQQQARRPDTEHRPVRQPSRQFGAGGQPIEPLRPFEQRPPRIDQLPQVSSEGRNIGKADPEDDPHERRRDVAVWVLIADEPGEHRDNEYAKRDEPQQQNNTWPCDQPAGRGGEQIDMRAATGGGGMTNEQLEDEE